MIKDGIPLLGDRVCAEVSSTVMKKDLDSIKARRSPHGQLTQQASSIKLLLLTSLGLSVLIQTASNYI